MAKQIMHQTGKSGVEYQIIFAVLCYKCMATRVANYENGVRYFLYI